MLELAPRLLVGFPPVILLLLGLIALDSYMLLGLRSVLAAIGAGCEAAGCGFLTNAGLIDMLGVGFAAYSRYVGPVVEEVLKALVVAWLIRSHRVGFLVDAAIFGFAIGTGFALVENLYYLRLLPDSSLGVWIVRGLGTAIMHGGTTAIFGMLSTVLRERRPAAGAAVFLPGLAAVDRSALGVQPLLPLSRRRTRASAARTPGTRAVTPSTKRSQYASSPPGKCL